MDINDISGHDRSQYFSDTVVFDKVSGEAVYVRAIGDRTAAVNRLGTMGHTQEMSIRDFQDRFLLCRPKLGWRNSANACIFGSSTPGRGYKKTYSVGEIKVFSPIFMAVNEKYQKVHLKWMKELDKKGELSHNPPKEVRHMKRAIQVLSDISPKTTTYLLHAASQFFSKRDAILSLRDSRIGAAINNYWAILQLPSNSISTAMVYRNRVSVGSIDLNTGTLQLSANYASLQPEWDRLS